MTVRRTRNGKLPARNRRAVQVAQDTLRDHVRPIAQEQYVNSLAVNGYSCVVYNRLQGGRVCSCSKAANFGPTSVLDDQGNAPQEVIDTLLTGTTVKVRDYGEKRNPGPSAIVMGDSLDDFDTVDNLSDDNDSGLASVVKSGELVGELDLNLDPESNGRCGVCYGTGIVGGYTVFNGLRSVLDATMPPDLVQLYDAAYNNGQFPYCFDLFSVESSVRFTTVIPVGVYKVDTIRLWNNLLPLTGYKLEISSNGTSWDPLNELSILQYRTGLPCYIKVSGVPKFTHLEIQFNCSANETYIEYPRLSKTGDVSILDAIGDVQLIVSPLVPSVQPWDLIYDNVFRKLWRVTESQWLNDAAGNIHGWDCQARLIQEYELYSRLTGREINVRPRTTVLNR